MTTIQITGEPLVMVNEDLNNKYPVSPEDVEFVQTKFVFPRPYLSDQQKHVTLLSTSLSSRYSISISVWKLRDRNLSLPPTFFFPSFADPHFSQR